MNLTAGSRAFVTSRHPRLDVDVVINGQTVDRWTFQYDVPGVERMSIPAPVVAGRNTLDVELRF